MSHISKLELEVRDLQVLEIACQRLGLELHRGKRTFKWFGKEAECDHCISVPGAEYEIGVVKCEGLLNLSCDFFDGNIEKAIGADGGLLKQAYAVEKARSEARKKGYTVVERQTQTGIQLRVQLA